MSEAGSGVRRRQDFEEELDASDAKVAAFEGHEKTVLDRVQHFLHGNPTMVPVIVLLLSVTVFGIVAGERFFSAFNLSLIMQQVSIIGILAAAQSLVILTAGIDLSVGAVMVLSSMVIAQSTVQAGLPAVLGLAAGLVVGLAAGALNGALVTRLKLPPFIVTLGTLSIFLALTLLYSGGATVRGREMPELLTWTGATFPVLGVNFTVGVVMMLLLYVVVAFILHKTAWGRHVYAVGDDRESARLAGISVNRVLMGVYLAAGAIIAIGAWIQIGRSNAASPNAGADLNLDSITAVVIGGTSLFGGRGWVWSALLGTLVIQSITTGLNLLNMASEIQYMITGAVLLIAVVVDSVSRRTQRTAGRT
jgi:fructose transport system permease protein